MTAQEKATQLVDTMYFIISNNGQFTGEHSIPNKFIEAKKCALIAVDERIDEMYAWMGGGSTEWEKNRYNHWQEVKQEIEKL